MRLCTLHNYYAPVPLPERAWIHEKDQLEPKRLLELGGTPAPPPLDPLPPLQ